MMLVYHHMVGVTPRRIMAVYAFSKDFTPPMPGSDLDRGARRTSAEAAFAEALTSGEAWRRLCDGLRSAGDSILRSPEAASPADLAEGYQYLLGWCTAWWKASCTEPTPPARRSCAQTDVVKVGN